jgi:hypothetical protein
VLDGGVAVEKVGSLKRIVAVQKWAVGDTCNLFPTTEKRRPVVGTSYPSLALERRATLEKWVVGMVEEMLYIYIVLNSFIKIDNHPYYYCNLFIA